MAAGRGVALTDSPASYAAVVVNPVGARGSYVDDLVGEAVAPVVACGTSTDPDHVVCIDQGGRVHLVAPGQGVSQSIGSLNLNVRGGAICQTSFSTVALLQDDMGIVRVMRDLVDSPSIVQKWADGDGFELGCAPSGAVAAVRRGSTELVWLP
jgi:hypothetical protein